MVGDCPDASIVNCNPTSLTCEILLAKPSVVHDLPRPCVVKSKVVTACGKPGSAGHVFFVGSQLVNVCAATKGNSATSAEVANSMISQREPAQCNKWGLGKDSTELSAGRKTKLI